MVSPCINSYFFPASRSLSLSLKPSVSLFSDEAVASESGRESRGNLSAGVQLIGSQRIKCFERKIDNINA
jgi:hypothetical protein